jgi:hypothetical protein
MILRRWRIGKQELLELRNKVAVAPVEDGGFAKWFHFDHRVFGKLMRRGKKSDIALSEQRPTVDSWRLVLDVTYQCGVDFPLQEEFEKVLCRLFSELNMRTWHEFSDLGYRLKNKCC